MIVNDLVIKIPGPYMDRIRTAVRLLQCGFLLLLNYEMSMVIPKASLSTDKR